MPDERDWVQVVLHETCPECGLRGADLAGPDVAEPLAAEAAAWGDVLSVDEARLRRRPEPDVWSALEYACHVRDTLALFARRVDRVLAEDLPELGWWDHEAAAVEDGYNQQDPAEVADGLQAATHALVTVLDRVGERWERAGIRRSSERLTIADMARFSLHEARHHRFDAERSV